MAQNLEQDLSDLRRVRLIAKPLAELTLNHPEVLSTMLRLL
jgi:hypothetical protein